MKKQEVKLLYCLSCGRMYYPNGNLVPSVVLRYLIYKSAHSDVKIIIVKGLCGICQN